MAQTNAAEQSRQQYGGASFEMPDYDVETIKPDAYAGQYEIKFLKCSWQMTSSAPPRPMIVLEAKLVDTPEESMECKGSLQAVVRDFIVLDNSSRGNQGKQKLRTLREKLELDVDFSRMNPETVKALAEQIKGKTMTAWVTNKEDGDGNLRTNLTYTEPRGAGAAMAPMSNGEEEEEEEEEDEAPARKAKGGKTKSTRR